MESGFLSLSRNDVVRGLMTAVFAAVFFSLAGVVQGQNFDVFTADWGMIGHMALNAAIAAFVGYLGKNFFTASNGAVFGVIGGTK